MGKYWTVCHLRFDSLANVRRGRSRKGWCILYIQVWCFEHGLVTIASDIEGPRSAKDTLMPVVLLCVILSEQNPENRPSLSVPVLACLHCDLLG